MAAPAGWAGRGLVLPEHPTCAHRWAWIRASEAGLSAKIAIGPGPSHARGGTIRATGLAPSPGGWARLAVGRLSLRTTILGCSLCMKRAKDAREGDVAGTRLWRGAYMPTGCQTVFISRKAAIH